MGCPYQRNAAGPQPQVPCRGWACPALRWVAIDHEGTASRPYMACKVFAMETSPPAARDYTQLLPTQRRAGKHPWGVADLQQTWLAGMNRGGFRILPLNLPAPPVGYAGNGNVLTANDSENGNWSYSLYDGVNRLKTATNNTTNQTFSYNFDTWGNMTCTNTGSLPCTPQGLSFNTSNNRISTAGYNYDAAGNLLSDNTHSYIYDAESRITCVLDAYGQCSQHAPCSTFTTPMATEWESSKATRWKIMFTTRRGTLFLCMTAAPTCCAASFIHRKAAT